jgi:hypothetical protein
MWNLTKLFHTQLKCHSFFHMQFHLIAICTSTFSILYKNVWPPMWSSGQSSWLQIQRLGFDSRRYHIFWEVVVLEQGPLGLMSTIEELHGRESSCSGLEQYGRSDPSCWPGDTFYPQKLALTLPTSGGRSVHIVRSRTNATELLCRNLWNGM